MTQASAGQGDAAGRHGAAGAAAGPGLGQAALRALGAAVLGAGIWIGLAGPFNVTWGLVAVALFVGWLVGSATRSGSPTAPSRAPGPRDSSSAAGATRPQPPDPRVQAIAAGGAALAWILALIGVYVYSLAALPSFGPASTSFAERVAATPITSFYAQQFGLLDALEAALLLAAAWWSAR